MTSSAQQGSSRGVTMGLCMLSAQLQLRPRQPADPGGFRNLDHAARLQRRRGPTQHQRTAI